MTLADAGYFAASHLAECDRRGQKVVVSEARQRFLEDPYHKDRFTYDEQSDSFGCPQGQTLAFVRIQHANGVPLRLYRATGAVCQACPAFRACTKAGEIGRSLAIGPHDAVLRRHRAWMSTWAAKEAYRLRKQLVEPVFGIIKEQQGGHGGSCCAASLTWRPSGPCWSQPSICAPSGGCGAPPTSPALDLAIRCLIPLPERGDIATTAHSAGSIRSLRQSEPVYKYPSETGSIQSYQAHHDVQNQEPTYCGSSSALGHGTAGAPG